MSVSFINSNLGMGKAGKALKQVLETYKIPQNRLAKSMQIERSAVYKWVHEEQDLTAESVANAVQALRSLNSEAAEVFIQLYLGAPIEDVDRPEG